MDDRLPSDLQNLTGRGKTILIERRRLVQLGLMHSDDEQNKTGWTLIEQMVQLNRRAIIELRRGHAE